LVHDITSHDEVGLGFLKFTPVGLGEPVALMTVEVIESPPGHPLEEAWPAIPERQGLEAFLYGSW